MGIMDRGRRGDCRIPKWTVRSLALCLALALAGCGGGGGSGSDGSPPRTPAPAGGGPSNPPTLPPGGGSPRPPPPPCPAGTVDTRPSLGRCIARDGFQQEAESLSRDYRKESRFKRQWGLGTIHADRAYAHLRLLRGAGAEPGEGVTIGFIDSGIDRGHPAFSDTSVTERFLGNAEDETGDRSSHGTQVASVAAGGQVDPDAYPIAHYGVAWGADITMFAIPFRGGGSRYQPHSPAQLNTRDLSDSGWFKSALVTGIDILNVSKRFDGIIEDYSESELRANYGRTIAVLAQKNTREKTILVWSAGNDQGRPCSVSGTRCVSFRVVASSPKLWAGLPARIAELRGHSVAAVAVDRDGAITYFSNRCGIAADYCIAAPGADVRVAEFGPSGGNSGARIWKDASGTSFAAPMVGGGLAIMKQIFRGQLSNTDLVARLFATANKTGRYADRSVYGQGLLDLGAATTPWGGVGLTGTGRTVAELNGGFGVTGSAIRPGPAMGDSLGRALGRREIAAFDGLGAPFWLPAGDFVRSPPREAASVRLRRFLPTAAPPEGGARWPDLRIAGRDPGHAGLAEGALRLGLSMPRGWSAALLHRPGGEGGRPLSGIAVQWHPSGLPGLALGAGWLAQRESLLGASASGAFGRLSGRTAFVSARLEADGPAGWRLAAGGEMGVSRPDHAGGTLVRGISTLRTGAFRVAAARALSPGGASVRLFAERPLRVHRGTAVLDLPTGRTVGGRVVGETVGVGLAPTGRQLDLGARIDRPLAGGALALGFVRSLRPGHRADAPSEWTVSAGWRKEF